MQTAWAEVVRLDFSWFEWGLFGLVALMIGMSKTGVSGISNVSVLIMAWLFGSKASTGIVLPLLIMADVFAVIYYRRTAAWKYIWKVLPAALVGILIGVWVGDGMPESQFRFLLGSIVLLSIVIMLWSEFRRDGALPDHPAFAYGAGLLGGFATMVGNSAGPVMSVYLLAMRLPKNVFIGTGAWFFFIINLCKVPLQYGVWGNIHPGALLIDLMLLPVIGLGAFVGFWIVKQIPEKAYKYFVITVTVLSALLLFFK